MSLNANPLSSIVKPDVIVLLLIGLAMIVVLKIVKNKQKSQREAPTISNTSFADGYFGLLYSETDTEPQRVVIFNSNGLPINTIYATDEQKMLGLTTQNGVLCLYTSESSAGIEKIAKWLYNQQRKAFEQCE